MTDEKKLLWRLKQKDINALNEAIEIYTPYLSTVLFNMAAGSLSKEDSEEIVSDCFITLWKNAENIDLEKGTVRSYIAAVARNFALRRLNKKREHASLSDIEKADEGDFAEETTFSDFVWKAVMSLGEPDSEIFVRYYKFGESIRDISKATGLNLSTVKTKLSRGRKKLKGILSNAEECDYE